ncbi:MAG TPA: bifunctional riboflavin kinase/FAD synthetase, partial [Usitatibacter sp.]
MRIVRHPKPGGPATAVAIGSFDGVHRGHAAILDRLRAEAARRGLAPAVLTFEPLPRELFAPQAAPPRLTSLSERLAEIARHGIEIAFVQRFDRRFAALDAEAFARRLAAEYGARHVLVGADFRYGAGRAGDVAALARAGERLGFT